MPATTTQIGRCGACGSCAHEQEHAEDADLGSPERAGAPRPSGAARLHRTRSRRDPTITTRRCRRAPAPRARRGGARDPVPRHPYTGHRERERARAAFCGEHPCGEARQAGFDRQVRRQCRPSQRDRSAAPRAFEFLAEPACAARDGFPGDALRRIAALEFAQAGEVGVVACVPLPADRRRPGRAAAAARRSPRRDRRSRSAESGRRPSRATGRTESRRISVTRPSATRPRFGAGNDSVTLSAAPAGMSPPARTPLASREIAVRVAAPACIASANGNSPPAKVSPAESGAILMPARLRNVCSCAAAIRPASRKVTPTPSDNE